MFDFKKFLEGRDIKKFSVSLASVALSLITAIVYAVCYAGGNRVIDSMSWTAFSLLFAAVAASVVLIIFKLDVWQSVAMSVIHFLAFLFYVYAIYPYVSAAAVGIDSTWDAQFFVTIILFIAGIALNITSFCLNYKASMWLQKLSVSATAVLLGIIVAGTVIANENAPAINGALGTTSFEVVGGGTAAEDYYKSNYDNLSDLIKAGNALGERAMGEGAVLLKNENNALPLKSGSRKVTLFGVASVDPVYGGTGSGSVEVSSAPTWKSALEKSGFEVNSTLWDWYNTGAGHKYLRKTGSTGNGVTGIKVIGEAPWSEVDAACGSTLEQYGNAAIVTLARIGGEGSDMPRGKLSLSKLDDSTGSGGDSTDGDYLKLSPKEKALLAGVKAKKDAGKVEKIIVVLNTTNQIEADFLQDEQYGIDAAMWIGTTGTTGLNAVAEILAGNVNPSGSLSATFWRRHKENPALYNFGVYPYAGSQAAGGIGGNVALDEIDADQTYVVYQEGVYVGYRYTETRYEDYVTQAANVGAYDYAATVTYPFGYGLSYTDFEYSDMSVEKSGSGAQTKYTVSVKVTNTGATAGKKGVQVYLKKPYGKYNIDNGIEAPAAELVGFAKTGELAPHGQSGDSEIVKIDVEERQFASYDANKAETYVITGGDYYLTVADNAHSAVNNILAKRGYTPSGTSGRMDDAGNAAAVGDVIALAFDEVTYSTTAATDSKKSVKIKNQFEFADFNKYANKGSDSVTYMTRNNWSGTTLTKTGDNVVLHWSDKLATDMNALGRRGTVALPEDNGAYPSYGTYKKDEHGNEIKLQLIDLRVDEQGNKIAYDDPLWEQLLDQLTWKECVDTIRYGMRRTELLTSINKPETIDHNGPSGLTEIYAIGKRGLANKTKDKLRTQHANCYPSGGILAATLNVDLMFEIGDTIGDDALWAGYSGLYGPGSNIQRTPYSGRNFEYYSEDGFLSGMICAYECAAMENRGLYVYNKHIGLNDQEDLRRGIGTWSNEQAIREIYMKAFELPITIAGKTYNYKGKDITLRGASGVMTAFNRMGLYWSAMNKGLMTGFLREECGMTGIAVTDMWMGATTPYMNLAAMVAAGTDLVDGQQDAAHLDLCKTGHADVAWAMRESMHRILYTVVQSNAMNGISADSDVVKVIPWWQGLLIGLNVGLAVLFAGSVAWIVVTEVLKRKGNKSPKTDE